MLSSESCVSIELTSTSPTTFALAEFFYEESSCHKIFFFLLLYILLLIGPSWTCSSLIGLDGIEYNLATKTFLSIVYPISKVGDIEFWLCLNIPFQLVSFNEFLLLSGLLCNLDIGYVWHIDLGMIKLRINFWINKCCSLLWAWVINLGFFNFDSEFFIDLDFPSSQCLICTTFFWSLLLNNWLTRKIWIGIVFLLCQLICELPNLLQIFYWSFDVLHLLVAALRIQPSGLHQLSNVVIQRRLLWLEKRADRLPT